MFSKPPMLVVSLNPNIHLLFIFPFYIFSRFSSSPFSARSFIFIPASLYISHTLPILLHLRSLSSRLRVLPFFLFLSFLKHSTLSRSSPSSHLFFPVPLFFLTHTHRTVLSILLLSFILSYLSASSHASFQYFITSLHFFSPFVPPLALSSHLFLHSPDHASLPSPSIPLPPPHPSHHRRLPECIHQ